MYLIKVFLIILTFSILLACAADKSESPTNTESKPQTTVSTSTESRSPTETLKTFLEAKNKKDAETIKKVISNGSLKMYEEIAKDQNITVDELLTKGPANYNELPVLRNESIEGDTATIEMQHPVSGRWEKMWFVKENGEWKVAIDKSLEETFGDLLKQMRKLSKESSDNSKSTGKKTPEDKK